MDAGVACGRGISFANGGCENSKPGLAQAFSFTLTLSPAGRNATAAAKAVIQSLLPALCRPAPLQSALARPGSRCNLRQKRIPMGAPIFHVDAFTDRPFAGNPAAVCVLSEERNDDWLQSVAREMNLSETAFLRREGQGWRLRWFTPTVEVDLCGHATLASAHVIWQSRYEEPGRLLLFQTASGQFAASKRGEAIELDFPAEPASSWPAPADLLEALGGTAARSTSRNRLDALIELESESAVRGLAPDFHRLATASAKLRGVIVTAASDDPGFDFVSRFFAPAVGIDEDPVTGSAHCCLGPFWSERLGKAELTGYQASARGGTVGVRVAGRRVFLSGRAVTIARGEIV